MRANYPGDTVLIGAGDPHLDSIRSYMRQYDTFYYTSHVSTSMVSSQTGQSD
jgi:hypothetical protein